MLSGTPAEAARRVQTRTLLSLALAGLVLAYAAWPAWSAWQLRAALKARDLAAIEACVDWDLLRSNLKRTVAASLGEGSEGAQEGVLGALKRSVGPIVANRMIDAAVTPRTLAHVLAGRVLVREIARDLPGLESTPPRAQEEADDPLALRHLRWAFFETPTRFRVEMSVPEEPGRRVVSILALEGVHWRLIDVFYVSRA